MSVVDPAESGKIRLNFSMLASKTFRPSFNQKFYFYKEYRPLFNEMAKKLKEFVLCLDFNMIKKLQDCLLVLNDSCEATYQEKEFVKLAVAGRHKKVHCIFVKHKFFHQSNWSPTIELNTTQFILFKSPRDLQQIDHFKRYLTRTFAVVWIRLIWEQMKSLIINFRNPTITFADSTAYTLLIMCLALTIF